MNDLFAYADIIILAIIAGIIYLRLRNVLGTREGFEEQRPTPGGIDREKLEEMAEQLQEKKQEFERDEEIAASYNNDIAAGVKEIRRKDPSFSPRPFLEGAKTAFDMILDAFAKGDKRSLKRLLDEDVYRGFEREIDRREQEDERSETTLVSIDDAEITDIDVTGKIAEVTVRFTSQQINVTRDAEGEIVAGDPSRVEKVIDLWTFQRNLYSPDPNWKLVATETENA